ncbi:transcription factor IIF subunit tfg1 [Malassezia cuniculi]|uniref:Transcription factor IIF subunit tfg1 n=1 Tax=Malassezia cuniculi TaxID=948313 RepID=A0AAF0ES14_9BASI|nr:transcription factor IIF subunit tfg1 [Malassezia cuniculi]
MSVKREGGSRGAADSKQDIKDAAPTTGYRDIPLYSMNTGDATIHLMKLAHHTRVDPNDTTQFIPPLKLNRKMPLRRKLPPAQPGDIVHDRWGKPVIAKDGKPLLWPGPGEDLEEIRPYVEMERNTTEEELPPGLTMHRDRLFKKRVREIHKTADAARKTRNEEFFPWVLEDFETLNEWESSQNPLPNSLKALGQYYDSELERRRRAVESGASVTVKEEPAPKKEESAVAGPSHAPWVGQLEGDSGESTSSHHVLFVFDDRNAGGFKVVPIKRQYKFMQTPRHAVLNEDQIEEEFHRFQKSNESDRWMMRSRFNTGAGLGMAMTASTGLAARLPSLALPSGGSLGWSSSRGLVAVQGERAGNDDDDLFGGSRKTEQGTTYDELDYDEDFADDEERDDTGVVEEDPESKELEERLKREMLADRIEDDDIKPDPDADDLRAINRRSAADQLYGGRSYSDRHDDTMLTGTGRQMRKIMKALSHREGNDIYDSDEEAKNPYAFEESDDDEDLDVLHPERAILKAREERARLERLAKENAPVENPATSVADIRMSPERADSPDDVSGTKRKGDPRREGSVKRARVRSDSSGSTPAGSPRSGSPSARTLSPLESEICGLIRSGKISSTSSLVQHFRQRLKADASLKEQLSAAVKRVAYMDKAANALRLKDGF